MENCLTAHDLDSDRSKLFLCNREAKDGILSAKLVAPSLLKKFYIIILENE